MKSILAKRLMKIAAELESDSSLDDLVGFYFSELMYSSGVDDVSVLFEMDDAYGYADDFISWAYSDAEARPRRGEVVEAVKRYMRKHHSD